MEKHVYPTPADVIRHLADFFISVAREAIAKNDRASIVLAGGNSPKALYQLLAADYRESIDWDKLDFFFGDERYVSFTDPANNGGMAAQFLFKPLRVAEEHIYFINTALSQADAATDYAKRIQRYFNGAPIRFDIILLGLGDNAHTASLFPNTPVLFEMKSLVNAVFVETLAAWRITMTAPLINESKQIVFLVYGADKAEAVFNVIHGERNIIQYPAQLIEPEDGVLHLFIDASAAALV